MTQLLQIYKCNVCGNMVEIVHAAGGQLVCCGQPMVLREANTTDAAVEKHVPVVERLENSVRVVVGKVMHPMTAEHYIEWIELFLEGRVFRQSLEPGEEPIAVFNGIDEDVLGVRAYCNLHGLWKKE